MALLSELMDFRFYAFNPYALAPFLVAVTALAQGFFIFASSRESHLNRCFLYVCLNAALWMTGSGFLLNSLNPKLALIWAHVLFTAISLMPATIFHLSSVLTLQYREQQVIVRFMYAQAVIVTLLSWYPSFFAGLRQTFFGVYPSAGMMALVMVIFVVSCFVMSLFNLLYFYFFSAPPAQKRQTTLLMLSLMALQLSFVDILTAYNGSLYPSGYIALLGFLLNVAFYQIRSSYEFVAERSRHFENEVINKTRVLSETLEELRAAQLKLLETGKMSALASLSAGILHQISQPITAIHGFTKFLKKEVNDQSLFYRPITLIEEQSVYLRQMLENLMEVIRHREIKKTSVNVNDAIRRALNLLADELRIQRIVWDAHLGQNLPVINADAIHLQQIFMNIVINAIHALSRLPKGRDRSLKITSAFHPEDSHIAVSFQDSGPGMSAAEKDRIFEPFFSTKDRGWGMGMVLCQDLISEHGGSIAVESEPDAGANFIVRLPLSHAVSRRPPFASSEKR